MTDTLDKQSNFNLATSQGNDPGAGLGAGVVKAKPVKAAVIKRRSSTIKFLEEVKISTDWQIDAQTRGAKKQGDEEQSWRRWCRRGRKF
jgi:hypothetical protein